MARYAFIAAQQGPVWGGSEHLWSGAAERLAREGNYVRISARNSPETRPEFERLRQAGCEVFYRPPVLPPFFRRQLNRVIGHPPYHESHLRALAKGMDLVVISQGGNLDGLDWIEAARTLGYRYAAISQNAVAYWSPNDDIASRLAIAHENAVATYFVSQDNLEISRLHFSSPLRNAKVVRNPFKVRYDARPPWPDEADGVLRLACVARLDFGHKSQDVLLQVLGLPKWRERPIRVSLVGKGPNEKGLRYLASQLGLTNVDFLGHLDNIEDVWSHHHALVLPSRYEGMALAVQEAMLCGRAPIVTDVGGNREVVRDNVNGFLAKAATVELVDETMERAWENRHRLREMGEAAAIDVRKWVSPDPAGDFARELASLVNGKSR